MSFDSDSSEGEDFISYEHYSPRHRRLARESHLSGRRSNVPKPSNATANAEETVANNEKPSTSSSVGVGGGVTSQQQQHESFFNSSRYHYTRNVTSSSAYSTEESTGGFHLWQIYCLKVSNAEWFFSFFDIFGHVMYKNNFRPTIYIFKRFLCRLFALFCASQKH